MSRPTGATRRSIVLSAILGAGATACAPVFSDLQSAKLVAPGQVELTPGIGTVKFSNPDEDDSGRVQDQFGIQAGLGLHEAVELRAASSTCRSRATTVRASRSSASAP